MKPYRYSVLILLLHFLVLEPSYAQIQATNWYMPYKNAITFKSGKPEYIEGSQMFHNEGGATISDKKGNLLFYSDGITVWNRNNEIMTNGEGLKGGYGSSGQSCVIVPKTADEKEYYIFTADEEGSWSGLQYSVVDMSLDGGKGAVTIKNVELVTPVCEKVTAIKHCNKKDYWILTHYYGSNEYYAYLASDTGVNHTPVISRTGRIITIDNFVMTGTLRATPDAKRIVAVTNSTGVEIADFDNKTGVVSNSKEIFNMGTSGNYGAEFSVDSRMLYLGISQFWNDTASKRYSGIFQYDISLPTVDQIISSGNLIYYNDSGTIFGALQRGPDDKIYMAHYEKKIISAINKPEVYGIGSDFEYEAITMKNHCLHSLPNFINDYDLSGIDSFIIKSAALCKDKSIEFEYVPRENLNGILWIFDDPGSGTANTSTLFKPSHTFSKTGEYTVSLIKYNMCGNDTIRQNVMINEAQLNLGNDTTICNNASLTINPGLPETHSYSWHDGSNAPTHTTSQEGLIWLQVTNKNTGCQKTDSIIISTKPAPLVYVGNDTLLCNGKSLLLNAQLEGAQFLWNDNSSSATKEVFSGGIYWVEVIKNGCRSRDTINIETDATPVFSLGPDKEICPNQTIELKVNVLGVNYIWQDGSTFSTYKATKAGTYSVTVSNFCGVSKDSLTITNGNCNIYVPNAFTPNNDGKNDRFRISGGDDIETFSLSIFNRWGEEIFTTVNRTGEWDGLIKGKSAPAGSYTYYIVYKKIASVQAQVIKGTVTLIR